MTQAQGVTVDESQAQGFLTAHFDPTITGVEHIGEGAWSRCFGFRRGDDDLVVRFGNYLDDFEKDQRAAAYATPDLPIPQVLAIGPAFGGHYAVSTRLRASTRSPERGRLAGDDPVHGGDAGSAAPGRCSADQRMGRLGNRRSGGARAMVEPSADGKCRFPERRSYGWKQRLAQSPEDAETFNWGYDLLQRIVDDSIPRHLYHADLMNRNVLVQDHKISGVFDWGCGCYGDHLYDLAWFEFWAPWYPDKDIAALRRRGIKMARHRVRTQEQDRPPASLLPAHRPRSPCLQRLAERLGNAVGHGAADARDSDA
ncbi:MAG: phosphotransferase [Caldilineaceae bacterium]